MGLPFSGVWELVSWALTPSGLEMTGCLGTEWPGAGGAGGQWIDLPTAGTFLLPCWNSWGFCCSSIFGFKASKRPHCSIQAVAW